MLGTTVTEWARDLCSEPLGASRSCPEPPRATRSLPELPGASRSRPKPPANGRAGTGEAETDRRTPTVRAAITAAESRPWEPVVVRRNRKYLSRRASGAAEGRDAACLRRMCSVSCARSRVSCVSQVEFPIYSHLSGLPRQLCALPHQLSSDLIVFWLQNEHFPPQSRKAIGFEDFLALKFLFAVFQG